MNEKMTYRGALDRLQTIVSKIESGEMDVDALADNLKEAKQLLSFCRNKLLKDETDVKKVLEE